MRLKKIIFITVIIFTSIFTQAQKKWNLLDCINYGMENNLNVKQLALQESFNSLNLKQSKLAQYPNFNFSSAGSFNSGRNQNPTSFTLTTQSYWAGNMQLQTSAVIFNWFLKRNTIAVNQWELQAAKANTDKLKNDIALTVANYYLQVLLAKEQVKIVAVQLQQTKSQYTNTRKLVDAGSLPELNAAELEAKIASDSANVIVAKGNVTSSLLALKMYMSIDAAQDFEIDTPPVEKIFVENIADLQPDVVYSLALANLPQQKYNDLKKKAALKNTKVIKASMFPALTGFGNLNTGYTATKIPYYDKLPTGTYSNTSLYSQVGSTLYNVVSPNFYVGGKLGYVKSDAFGNQIKNNFSQAIGLSLSIPIFNGGSAKTNYEKSKLTYKNLELQQKIDDQKLKQDIYTAYNNAIVAYEKFNASKKSLQTADRSYSFAQKRYNVGMLTTLELITNQNNLFTQQLQNTLNQFDYVFKMKVLEFYKGQGLK